VSTKNERRKPLLQYWTSRYFITLLVGIIIIGFLSGLLIRFQATQQRLKSLSYIAEEFASAPVDYGGVLVVNPLLARQLERTLKFLGLDDSVSVIIIDNQGNSLFTTMQIPPLEIIKKISIQQGQEYGVQKINLQPGVDYHVVKQAIKNNDEILGYVVVMQPSREVSRSPEEYQLLIMMLSGVTLLGWLIIYTLTRNLARPIKEVAAAAKQIVTGNYDLTLDKNPREEELYELVHSFQEMSEKLRQLETLRTELLAGVTHELRTPVTAISGLLQAVRENVVTGEEADEFLDICAKETKRLQKTVEDLLDFNAFVTGDIKVNPDRHNLHQLIPEIVYQWQLSQENCQLTINNILPEHPLLVRTDAMRLQQIIYNLLNNAQQALPADRQGTVEVLVKEEGDKVRIELKDDGPGIPAEEQELIFERFYRGTGKKDKIRGLGLGLPFSKMIARAMGGNLFLKSSIPGETIFTIELAKERM